MDTRDIVEGGCYVNASEPGYYRLVELVVESSTRPGGKVVSWSTDNFLVRQRNGDTKGKTHGKCGIETFAKWATSRID